MCPPSVVGVVDVRWIGRNRPGLVGEEPMRETRGDEVLSAHHPPPQRVGGGDVRVVGRQVCREPAAGGVASLIHGMGDHPPITRGSLWRCRQELEPTRRQSAHDGAEATVRACLQPGDGRLTESRSSRKFSLVPPQPSAAAAEGHADVATLTHHPAARVAGLASPRVRSVPLATVPVAPSVWLLVAPSVWLLVAPSVWLLVSGSVWLLVA